jgi:diadenylate cyclase
VAKQTGFPVVSVSQSMRIVALYVAGRRIVLEDSSAILSRANQALQTLERYKSRLDEVTGTLSALEIEDLVTVRDVANVLQRLEMVRRIKDEIADYVVQLGTDGRLLSLQLEELTGGLSDDLGARHPRLHHRVQGRLLREEAIANLEALDSTELLDPVGGAKALGFTVVGDALDSSISPTVTGCSPRCRGCPGPSSTASSTTSGRSRSCSPPTSMTSMEVDGVGEGRARLVREGLSRLAESSILERYV